MILALAGLALAQKPATSEIRHPEPIGQPLVEYPASERSSSAPDVVCLVDLTVDRSGVPSTIEVRQCPPAFVEATKTGLADWRFSPATRDGEPVEAPFRAKITFRMRDDGIKDDGMKDDDITGFLDMSIGLGVVHTPDVLPGEPARTSGVLRAYFLQGGSDEGKLPGWLTLGADVDLRGFRRLLSRTSFQFGVNGTTESGARMALTTGLGFTTSGLRRDDTFVVAFVPVNLAGGIVLGRQVGLVARGGVGVPFFASGLERPRVIPSAVVGLVAGERSGAGLAGVRLEVGFREEFGQPVWSVVAGIGY